MANVTLVLGGARSGKSRFAESLILKTNKNPVYIATAEAHDEEMRRRIRQHRFRRDINWKTLETPLELIRDINNEGGENRIILVDCLTLWLSNLMIYKRDIAYQSEGLLYLLKEVRSDIVLVANEIGLGIVPECRLNREFRDYAGQLNQGIAAIADTVYFIVAGLPLILKG
ncbi:MAG: adenosylcobinamide kinase / adenosylcobinamide-phosphate guanylyltransferase [Candidatus Tokpelaia sp. JSC188]|nr:MAG: adenosylcobinamide kinase / adenosylcobinamide-phosphate guanylyltransferase [Candidatus Tokpelaia sp. JSC188]